MIDAESPPKADPDELPDIEESNEDLDELVDLPYPLDLCIELWRAWTEFGIMPLAGGFLQQPRKWHTMIRLFNSRHNGVRELRAAEKQERDYFSAHVNV